MEDEPFSSVPSRTEPPVYGAKRCYYLEWLKVCSLGIFGGLIGSRFNKNVVEKTVKNLTTKIQNAVPEKRLTVNYKVRDDGLHRRIAELRDMSGKIYGAVRVSMS